MFNIKVKPIYLAIMSGLFLTACQSGGGGVVNQATGIAANNLLNSQGGGGSIGNQVVGGLVQNQLGGGGSGQLSSALIGALANNVVGGSIGQTLDTTSRNAALTAEYNALERGSVGQPIQWQGQGGARGQVIPQQTYQVGSQNCRRYTHTIFIDGQPQEASGTACRNPDGVWQPLT